MLVRLTPTQVAKVCSDVGVSGGTEALLTTFCGDDAAIGLHQLLSNLSEAEERNMSRSFLRGLVVLAQLPREGDAVGVVQLAERLGMSPSTVHRYLTTLVAVGLVRQRGRSRAYCRV